MQNFDGETYSKVATYETQKYRCMSNVNLDSVNKDCERGNWIELIQDRVQRLGLANPVRAKI
jgi:hypothetical protein